MKKHLPSWIQSFEKIRDKESNYIYIDKTKYIDDLLSNNINYVFLSRPRRFGKSLFIDTLKCLFEWKKHLFEWLYIYDKWNWDKKYPVIKISFGTLYSQSMDWIIKTVDRIIDEYVNIYQLDKNIYEKINYWSLKLATLIQDLYSKTNLKVVLLVDEYDKPILDNITNNDLSSEVRDYLRWLYSVIKDSDEYLKFVMLTWVTKFSKVSVFSWLNNLTDITISEDFNWICGYTIDDIKTSFTDYTQNINYEILKNWYNWYCFWDLTQTVYNPYWLLQFFINKWIYKNYWFATATPSFLVRLMQKNDYVFDTTNLESITVWEEILDSFDVEKINLTTLLFQSWYLTIKDILSFWVSNSYVLWVPNIEVRNSLNNVLIRDYLWFENSNFNSDKLRKIYWVLQTWDIEWYIKIIKSIFAWIPYSNYVNNPIHKYEWFYSSVMYSFMAFTWIEFISEDFTNKGRIDFTMKIDKKVYIIELKVEQEWDKALTQIKDRKYSEKYSLEDEIYLVGINFDEELKNVWDYEWERVK